MDRNVPSVDLVNDYEVKDVDGTAKDWDQSSFYKAYQQNGGYVSTAIYQNRDNRFYATVVAGFEPIFQQPRNYAYQREYALGQ